MTDVAETNQSGTNRRVKVIIASVAIIVALLIAAFIAAPRIYSSVMGTDAPGAPTLSQNDTGEPVEPADISGSWAVTDGFAGYRVDEVLRGENVTVVGRTEQFSGEFTLDDQSVTAGSVSVDVASIETDSGNRDNYFRSQAMQADQYPTAEFVLTEPISLPDGPITGEPIQITAAGEMTIRDVTQPVTADLEVVFEGSGVRVVGSIPVTFTDFGVEAPSLGFVEVEDQGAIELDLTLERA